MFYVQVIVQKADTSQIPYAMIKYLLTLDNFVCLSGLNQVIQIVIRIILFQINMVFSAYKK